MRYLKEIATGTIYPWSESWAKNPAFVEVDPPSSASFTGETTIQVAEPSVSVQNKPKHAQKATAKAK